MWTKQHTETKPNKLVITATEFDGVNVQFTYAFRVAITGDDTAGYDYYEQVRSTQVVYNKTELKALSEALIAQYKQASQEFSDTKAVRDKVEGYAGKVLVK